MRAVVAQLAVLLVAGSLIAGPVAAENRHIMIGVRIDAGPFARFEPDTESFRGYLVDLCREAVTRAGYTFAERKITAAQRIEILKGNIDVKDDDGSWKLDLLCDPTTLSLSRLDHLANLGTEVLTYSQVVFVANGSYVELKGRVPREATDLKDANCPPANPAASSPAKLFVAGYVEGATSSTLVQREAAKVAKGETLTLCAQAFSGHEEAARAICAGKIDFYFGDLDIIEFYRARAADNICAKFVPPQQVLSYEPYAFLVSNANPGFRPRFIAALYELFSDGTAAQRFASHFAGASQSTALNLLFRINSVPGLRDPVSSEAARTTVILPPVP